jgi:hypothetical protein
MVNKVFKDQLRGITEEYVDDMLVKSMMFEQHLLDNPYIEVIWISPSILRRVVH